MMTPAQAALECVEAMDYLYMDPPACPHGGVLVKSRVLDDVALIWPRKDHTVMAFAGTRNVAQWFSNFDYHLRRTVDGARVHEGTYNAVTYMVRDIHNALFRYSTPLHICGHSRGALLAGEWIRRDGSSHDVTQFTTLGGPRIGDAQFGQIVTMACAEDCQFFRITNNNDPVPVTPPSVKGYRHFGELWHIDRKGKAHKSGLGMMASLWDGIAGRAGAAWKRVAFDGISDHRVRSGYGPAVRAWHASESAAPVDGGKTEGGA
jgi:hypothetical protein